MRNLRQFFRRSGQLSSDSRRRRAEKKLRNDVSQRRLSSEVLEKRELLAGDILAPDHNYWNRYDVNDDGAITARDALAVINKIGVEAEAELAGLDGPTMYYDVNADSQITAADALSVINATSRGEEVGELIELMLTARDDNDVLLPVDGSGDVNVQINTPFNLEVSYDDLRLFNERLGAFQLFTDISVSQSNVLVPVLNETQRLIIDGAVTTSPFPTSITFSIPQSPPNITGDLTYVSAFNDFANSGRAEVINALTTFGYTTDQFSVSALDFGNSDQGFEIHWIGNEFGNINLPNISVEVDEASGPNIATQTVEFAPFEADGTTPNSGAVRFNVNSFSRTFNANERFYSTQNNGFFDPASGFTFVGGIGGVPTSGGGIPQLTDDGFFIEPFDAFSLRVMITQPVTDLVIGVNPGEDNEATLLYGRDDAVPQDMVLIETTDSNGNGIANVTFNATDGNTDLPPEPNGALPVTEDVVATIDLSTLTSNFTSLSIATNGTLGNAVIAGNTLTYTPNANANGNDTVVVTATNANGSTNGTIAVTIAAVQDNPVANDDSVSATSDTPLTIQAATLLANDVDVDGDTLTITAVGNPANTNATAVLNGTTITYTPASGFTGTDTFSYTISDGTATSTATVTVTVSDGNVAPNIADGTLSTQEDTTGSLDLSSLLSGGTPTSLTVSTNGMVGSASITGNILTYTPNANANGSDSVVVTVSNASGSDTGTIVITIAAVNDDPVAQNDSFSTAQSTTLVITGADLISNDSDVDGDPLTVTAVGDPSVAGATAILSGGNVTYTPAAGSTASDSFSYTISDGNGGTATATVSITVGIVAPVAGDGNLGVTQDAASTLDLLTLLSGGAADTLTVTTNGSSGSAVISGTILTYTPTAGATGMDSIVYTATNAAGSDTGTITVTITAANTVMAADAPLPVTEDGTGTIDLANLVSGSANPTLTISTNADNGSASISGTTLTYTPDADFFGGNTIVYTATAGSSSDTGTITVTVSSVNDAPNAQNDTATTFGETVNINVLGNDNAGPSNENQALTVVAASSNNGTATINANGTVAFTPTAGFTGNATVSYTIQDSDGAQDTGTVNVTVQNFNPSTISGAIFIDHVENIQGLLNGDAPIRNGQKDADETGLSGVPIRLVSQTTGATVATAFTNLDGMYSFENVGPGAYRVVYSVPTTVIFTGSPQHNVSIGSAGGATEGGKNFAVLGTTGSAMNTVDILAASYLRTNATASQISGGGREGGIVSLDSQGDQNFFIAGEGFEDTVFAELVLNQNRDAALLTIVEDNGDVLTARLSSNQFVVSRDGTGVQFFGGKNDFSFGSSTTDLIEQEFVNFRNAIDQILGDQAS